jgi:tripartite-type tricarboxylate transporter receptor subunit TctC
MMKFRFLILILAFTVCAAPLASAGDWPNRPVRFIVPFPAGGSSDLAARVIGARLSRSLGQQIVVENKGGANGNIGIEYAAKSAPDGYTILVSSEAASDNHAIYKLNFDPMRDLVPVIEVSHQPIALAAHPSLGIKTLADLTALAKQKPGMRFATGSGVGSLQAVTALWYAKLAGITLEQVPYRGGGPAIIDLMAGHVLLGSLGSTPLIPHYKAGSLMLLAQSMATRAATLPDVPTFQEAGFKELVIDQRIGVTVPKGTPAEIVTRLNTEINKALREDSVRQNFTDQAQEAAGGTSEEYVKLFRSDSDLFVRLVNELNIKVVE